MYESEMYKSVPMYYLKTKIVTDFSDTDTLLYSYELYK